jgi:DNA polymerase III epsilon subunit family exonuclease
MSMTVQSLTIADMHLSQTTFVVLDLETSGAAPSTGAGITEIGAVKVKGGQIIGEFQSFVNPGVSISPFITQLTGITDAMLMDAPRINEIFPTFIEFLGPEDENVLVAHNAPFDIGFLKAAATYLEYPWPSHHVADTARLARYVLTKDDVINCKLSTLAQFFGATTSPTHRALDDARATVDVLHGIIERLGGFGITTLPQFKKVKKRLVVG